MQYVRAVLRRALNQALKWGYVSRNVATLTDTPKVPRHEAIILSPLAGDDWEDHGLIFPSERGTPLDRGVR